MCQITFIFLPNSLNLNKQGYLEGFYKKSTSWEAYYVTNDIIQEHSIENVIGSCTAGHKNSFRGLNCDYTTSNFTINGINRSFIKIIYDYITFKQSNVLDFTGENYVEQFKILAENLQVPKNRQPQQHYPNKCLIYLVLLLDILIKFFRKIKSVVQVSSTLSHFQDSLLIQKWFLNELMKERKITPKIRNFLLAKSLDLIIGIIILYFCLKNEKNTLNLIEETRESLIKNLKELLKYLMGSPIGLKLNYALNNSLGKFFFYHITLWRLFLQGVQPVFVKYFKCLVLPAIFGFSFQIAMFSDIISIATFHVYCIYVYAARMVYFQLRGLLSLWRLFIGRKFNPLRQRVDSYQYSQDQLFIGTLCFTILLFLLPTIALYYTVFTIFRLGILLTERVLFKVRHLMNFLPVYIGLLWLCRSSSLAGILHLNWMGNNNEIIYLEAKLNTLSFMESLKKFTPVIVMEQKNPLNFAIIFHNICTGILI